MLTLVEEFHESFGYQSPETQQRLICEEAREFIEAVGDFNKSQTTETMGQVLKECADVAYVSMGFILLNVGPINSALLTPAQVEDFTASSLLLQMLEDTVGVDILLEAFRLVHESNMSKLDENGQVLRREDGKVLKGPNYVAPDLTALAEAGLKRIAENRLAEMEEAA